MANGRLDLELLRSLSDSAHIRISDLTPGTGAFRAVAEARKRSRLNALAEALPEAPLAVAKALMALDDEALVRTRTLDILAIAIEAADLPDEQKKRLEATLRRRFRRVTEEDGSAPADDRDPSDETDTTLENDPGLASAFEQARISVIGRATGLTDSKIEAVLAAVPALPALNEQRIAAMVVEGTLEQNEAGRFGAIAGLAVATGGDAEAAVRIAALKVSRLTDVLDADDSRLGQAILGERASETDPEQVRAEGAALKRKIEARFPNEGIRRRLVAPDREHLTRMIQISGPALRDVEDVLTRDPGELDLPDDQAEAVNTLRGVVNAYVGLGLDQLVLADGSPAEIATRVNRSIAQIDSFVSRNAERDLLRMDFTPGSDDMAALDFGNADEAEQTAILGTLKARSRAFRLTGDVDQAERLVRGGAHSALMIGEMDEDELVRRTGMDAPYAKTVMAAARDTRIGVGNLVATMVDELRWRWPDLVWVIDLQEDVTDGLKNLPGYEDLFGDQSFCNCAHCDSILSPSAYFVDLMNFIDRHVTSKEFKGATEEHALKLQIRRPDLWTLHLTCANTHDLVPTLELINEILENAIAVRESPGINLTDRAAVRDVVYVDTLPTAIRSFVTPFDIRVASVDRYISSFDTDRVEIVDLVRADASVADRNAAALRLSLPSSQMIVTPRAGLAFLEDLYGIDFVLSGNTVNAFNVQRLLPWMAISRDDLGKLINARFVTNQGSLDIRIRSQKRSEESVQNDIERISGLTGEALDRMHRFWRLRTALGWDIEALDMAIGREGGVLTDEAVAAIVFTDRLATDFGLDVEEALALTGTIPATPTGDAERSLRDRLFNTLTPNSGASPLPAPSLQFVHPGLRDDATLPEIGPDAAEFIAQRLRLATKLDDSGLLALIVGLAPSLGIDPEAPSEDARSFSLTHEHLSLLYRHALLAHMLDAEIDDLFLRIRIATGVAAIATVDQLAELLAFERQIAELPYGPTDFAALLGLDGTAMVDAEAVADALIDGAASDEALAFAPTVFAYIEGVTEDQSRAIVRANAGLFEGLERDMLHLAAEVDLAPAIVAPPGGFPDGVGLGDLQATLEPFNARTILPARLAAALELSVEKLESLAALASTDLTAPDVIATLYGGPSAPLHTAVERLGRPLIALGHDAVQPSNVDFVAVNGALFTLADPVAPLSRNTVLHLGAFVAALAAGDGTVAHSMAVGDVLTAHSVAQGFADAATDQLALATGADPAVVRVFEAGTVLPDTAPLALDRLRRVVAFAEQRKLGADCMALVASSDPDALAQATASLLASLRVRIGDAESFETVVEQHEDALRGRRRDALVDFLIRSSNGRFADTSDLYEYYLVDPKMEGCARTSRVVAAVGSLQTYVNRILLNLEQDRRAPDEDDHVAVAPSRIPQREWAWRKNYRVWEANRKVFLWPENYMQPAFRDNKTPLFEVLEQAVQQQDVNEQTVLDAYAAYLKGFEEVASLRIAGAYHEHNTSTGKDILHVFGCTADDPPVYYYWTVENVVFSKLGQQYRISYSPRRRIDVSIPVRDVSPFIFNNRLHLFWLEITTQSDNVVEDGESSFVGYKHVHKLKYTNLRLDGSWTAPQEVFLGRNGFVRDGGMLNDILVPRKAEDFSDRVPRWASTFREHFEYEEGYTLDAPAALRLYPFTRSGELRFTTGARSILYAADLFERKAVKPATNSLSDYTINAFHAAGTGSSRRVYFQPVDGSGTVTRAHYNAVFDYVKSREAFTANITSAGYGFASVVSGSLPGSFNLAPGDLGASIAAVNDPTARIVVPISDWSETTMFVQKDADVSFLSQSYDPDGRPYESRRLGTTLTTDLSRILFYDGVNGLLAKDTQKQLKEKTHLVTSRNYKTKRVGPTTRIDYTGPLGVYYREIFLHIPALLAEHQNARGNFAAALEWYAKIFDPTAEGLPSGALAGLSRSQRRQAERDRVWQYLEFEGLRPPSLRAILTDEDAQEAYRKDPFNPYAIARLRLSAFQKNIVMRYVSNLIDWADSLFAMFTRESVDEAHVLYNLALQILGPRPADVGDCGEGNVRPRTYERIKPHIERGQDFLIEAETYYFNGLNFGAPRFTALQPSFVELSRADVLRTELVTRSESKIVPEVRFDATRPPSASDRAELAARNTTEKAFADDITVRDLEDELVGKPALEELPPLVAARQRFVEALDKDGSAGRQFDWKRTRSGWNDRRGRLTAGNVGTLPSVNHPLQVDAFIVSVVKQVGPVFCVPRNKDLLALWDRVEDRLYKIRNCLNIDGERVDLALFAPEIDPNALVRARAAGLSLSDILGAGAGNLPPYRFSYLIGKARDYVGLVQIFGAKLQAALEKRDAEELALLRLTHAANMQNMVTKIREQEMDTARVALEELNRRKEAIEYRIGYWNGTIDEDLLSWERTQQIVTHGSTIAYAVGAALGGTSGVLHLIPQLGSPFAMKYGGYELGSSLKGWSLMLSDTAKLLDVLGRSVGLEAKFQRRRKEWGHQLALSEHDLKEMEKKIEAAEIRIMIAERALANHKQAIADQEEILDFYESKFTGLELYTYMAANLQGLYRTAFNAAHSMARLAEASYRFERPQDGAALLEPSYWEAGKAGLLSGERLAADLIGMEKRFIETNYRVLEIAQPFSLARLDPAALIRLKEQGETQFTVPEFAFDLLYPGHYRRRIRAVRLSIACVTGPYVNIPATLTLGAAQMRPDPTTDGPAGLVDSQLRHTTTIATSTAQGDAGVFDFNYSDARYMPFEGAGAVNTVWTLVLPKNFRPFSYETINDVVLEIAYTAESDGVLREHVESENAALQGAMMQVLSDEPMARAFGFRQEFSTAFNRLLTSPQGTEGLITLDSTSLPLPLQNREIAIDRALFLLKPGEGRAAVGTQVSLNATSISGFADLPEFPGFRAADASAALAAGLLGNHTVSIADPGDLGPGMTGAIEPDALVDMILYVEVSLA